MTTPIGIEAEVCADIAERQRVKGIPKYGVTVADNPLPLKDWLQLAYEESLDKSIYLKRAIREIEKAPKSVWWKRDCQKCGQPLLFIRNRNFDDGSGRVWMCENGQCETFQLYVYPDSVK